MEFKAFAADMGERPTGGMLERINNDGNYEPSNCRWATRVEQQNNRAVNRILTLSSEALTVRQWEKKMGYKRGVILNRLRMGWSTEQAILTLPVVGNKPHHRVSQ